MVTLGIINQIFLFIVPQEDEVEIAEMSSVISLSATGLDMTQSQTESKKKLAI